jgi:hypothetical protein
MASIWQAVLLAETVADACLDRKIRGSAHFDPNGHL